MFNWLFSNETSDIVREVNINEFRTHWKYSEFRENTEIALKYFNDSAKVFEQMIECYDVEEFNKMKGIYENRNTLAGIYVGSSLAMVRYNEAINYGGVRNVNKFMRKFWKMVGFKFNDPAFIQAFKELKITPVIKEEDRGLNLDVVDFKSIPIEIHEAGNLDEFGHNTSGFGYFY